MRYCLTGDTLVNTNRGLIAIKDIVKQAMSNSETDIDLNVLSIGNKINKASKFFNSGEHEIKEIKTKEGYSIKGSHNHPVLTLTKGLNGEPTLYWKTLENVSVGDYIVLNRDINGLSSNIDLVSEEEAKFLGSIISEGYLNLSNNRLGFTNSNLDWVNQVKKLMEDVLGIKHVCEYPCGNCREVCVHSKEHIQEWIDKYDLVPYSENVVVPSKILQSSLNIQAIFLKYLFEGDGSPTFAKRKRGSRITTEYNITYTSQSLKLLNQIQIMLLQWGIYSKIHADRKCHRLIITGKTNLKNFCENIGFAFETKQAISNEILEYTKNVGVFETYGKDFIPFVKEYIQSKYGERFANRHGIVNSRKFNKNKTTLKEKLSKEDFELINNLHSLNYLYLPVSEINDLEKETVYSIKVDSDCHSFVANGILNHNTEAKLSPIAMEMLKELNKEIVEFMDNFDAKEKEPTILPTILPNLFLNGTDGIAVGMKTEIPSHNLNELCNAIQAYIKKPSITTKELLEYLPAPDFPTGGVIVNKDDMLDLYETGVGKILLRAKIEQEDAGYGKTNLIIKEIPYTQSGRVTKLIESIAQLVKDKKLDEISDIRDESGGMDSDVNAMRIVLEVKKNVDINKLLNKLYKKTKLQDTQGCSFLVIDKGQPRIISLKDYIALYLEFQEEILTKKYEILLKKAINRKEVVAGLLRAIDCIDLIIEILRGSKNQEMVRKCLMYGDTTDINFKTKKNVALASKLDFTELQVNAILDMKLQRLINLEMTKLVAEDDDLSKRIDEYEGILSNKKKLYKVISDNLKYLQKTYSKERKTKITNSTIVEDFLEVEVLEEDVQILIDRFGYVKTVDMVSVQRSSEETIKQYKQIITAKNTDKLCLFTNKGNLHQIKLSDIPKGKIKDKGLPLDVLCKFEDDEEIMVTIPYNNLAESKVIFAYNDGLIKKVNGTEFETIRKKTVATKLYKDNKLIGIVPITTQEKLILHSERKDYVVDILAIPEVGKNIKGEKIKLLKKDEVNSIIVEEVISETAMTKEEE